MTLGVGNGNTVLGASGRTGTTALQCSEFIAILRNTPRIIGTTNSAMKACVASSTMIPIFLLYGQIWILCGPMHNAWTGRRPWRTHFFLLFSLRGSSRSSGWSGTLGISSSFLLPLSSMGPSGVQGGKWGGQTDRGRETDRGLEADHVS